MNFKFKSALVAFALLAVGAAHANQTIKGTINSMRVTTGDNNSSVWMYLNDSVSCNNAGPVVILRTGPHMGTSPAAEKTFSNMYALLLAAKLANKSVTAIVDQHCSLLDVSLSN